MLYRYNWLDIGKGIVIILMVIGHTSIPKGLSDFIWAFHMPFFFLASGYVTNWGRRSIWSFILHRSRTLILPFAIYSAVVLFLMNVFLGGRDIHEWVLHGWQGYALWFIPVLYVSTIISRCIFICQNERIILLSAIGLALVGASLRYNHIYLPWTMSSVPYASSLIIGGGYFEKDFLSRS